MCSSTCSFEISRMEASRRFKKSNIFVTSSGYAHTLEKETHNEKRTAFGRFSNATEIPIFALLQLLTEIFKTGLPKVVRRSERIRQVEKVYSRKQINLQNHSVFCGEQGLLRCAMPGVQLFVVARLSAHSNLQKDIPGDQDGFSFIAKAQVNGLKHREIFATSD